MTQEGAAWGLSQSLIHSAPPGITPASTSSIRWGLLASVLLHILIAVGISLTPVTPPAPAVTPPLSTTFEVTLYT